MSVATPRATNRVIDALVRRRTELKNNNDRGFSLIELLVVVLIIGVLAAIAIPIYMNSVTTAEQSAVEGAASTAKSSFASYVFEYESDNNAATTAATAAADAIAENSKAGEMTISIIDSAGAAVAATAVTDANIDDIEFVATNGNGVWAATDGTHSW